MHLQPPQFIYLFYLSPKQHFLYPFKSSRFPLLHEWMDEIKTFHSLKSLDLFGCRLGDDHDIFQHLTSTSLAKYGISLSIMKKKRSIGEVNASVLFFLGAWISCLLVGIMCQMLACRDWLHLSGWCRRDWTACCSWMFHVSGHCPPLKGNCFCSYYFLSVFKMIS